MNLSAIRDRIEDDIAADGRRAVAAFIRRQKRPRPKPVKVRLGALPAICRTVQAQAEIAAQFVAQGYVEIDAERWEGGRFPGAFCRFEAGPGLFGVAAWRN